MADIIFWTKHTIYRIAYFIIHTILDFYYSGKKQIVPSIKNPLLLKSACKLAEEIRDGIIKSEEVVQAYIERIQEVEPYINAVVQDRFRETLKEAQEVDKVINEIARSGSFAKQQLAEEKPFFGVPFTIKLLIKVEGLPCTAGSKIFKNEISTEDAACVALIKKAGGIILANTNTPEFGFSLECYNLLHGKTCNPYDTTRTPGASSGGESALLGAGASVIGIGNDMLGSVRLPAHFTGIFSHKPTRGLVNSTGIFPIPHPDHEFLICSGPMCRYSEDLGLMMKVFTENSPLSRKFGQKVNFQKLKIYYSTSVMDCKIPPVDKEIVSSMLRAIAHFTDNYHVVAEEVKIPLLDKSTEINLHFLRAPLTNLIKFITLGKVDCANRPLEMLKCLVGKSTFSFPTLVLSMVTTYPYIVTKKNNGPQYEALRDELRKDLDNILDENSVFFFPTHPVTAPYHYEMSSSLSASTTFTAAFNFTGHPATQCPLGLSKDGLPYGMQIIGGINNDPLTIACAVELDKIFGGWIPPECNDF